MTIAEAIKILESVPQSKRHLPLYVRDESDNLEAKFISLWADDEPHCEENPLAVTAIGN